MTSFFFLLKENRSRQNSFKWWFLKPLGHFKFRVVLQAAFFCPEPPAPLSRRGIGTRKWSSVGTWFYWLDSWTKIVDRYESTLLSVSKISTGWSVTKTLQLEHIPTCLKGVPRSKIQSWQEVAFMFRCGEHHWNFSRQANFQLLEGLWVLQSYCVRQTVDQMPVFAMLNVRQLPHWLCCKIPGYSAEMFLYTTG